MSSADLLSTQPDESVRLSRVDDEDYGQRIGRRIRAARIRRGWTQAELAHAMSEPGHVMQSAQVSRWERGEVVPQRQNLQALADALGVYAESFLHDQR